MDLNAITLGDEGDSKGAERRGLGEEQEGEGTRGMKRGHSHSHACVCLQP